MERQTETVEDRTMGMSLFAQLRVAIYDDLERPSEETKARIEELKKEVAEMYGETSMKKTLKVAETIANSIRRQQRAIYAHCEV